jgi:hypothetical protein
MAVRSSRKANSSLIRFSGSGHGSGDDIGPIRGDPEAALLWISKSQRHLSAALAERGFTAGQKLVGRLLRRLGFSLQANSKTREGASHPDRNAQFEHINAHVAAFQAAPAAPRLDLTALYASYTRFLSM